MQHTDKLISVLRQNSHWKILDVGGGEQPCLQATDVIDIYLWTPSERQGIIGKTGETGTGALNFIEHDINNIPWPKKDKELSAMDDKSYDFVICSNVLEDIRDPMAVCREMSRVAQRGMIEVPCVLTEINKGVDETYENYGEYPGYYHHRWFVGFSNNRLEFLAKHMGAIGHSSKMPYKGAFQIWWEGKIDAVELIALSRKDYDVTLRNMIEREESLLGKRVEL